MTVLLLLAVMRGAWAQTSPSEYCQQIRTDDALRSISPSLVSAVVRLFQLEAMPPAQVERSTYFFCPVGDEPRAKFTIIDNIDAGLKTRYEAFLATNDIEVAGIESIVDASGTAYTHDLNTNTNYNADAENRAGRSAMTTPGFLALNWPACGYHGDRWARPLRLQRRHRR